MLLDKLAVMISRSDEITKLLSDSKITSDLEKLKTLSKEQSTLLPIVEVAKEYTHTLEEIASSKLLLEDKELASLAKEELKILEEKAQNLESSIKILLEPKDENDNKNVYLELRAGSGGDEAGIFVGDMFRTYCRYADLKGWKIEIISSSENNVGGYKEIIALVKGSGAYSKLKYESGTHRVQRVPETESQGRIHTSAITIALMPEIDDIEVQLNPNDLKIEVFRAGGNGGQCVNTTDSAVRITHLPTNISVSIQDEKSQHKNKEKALKILKARIFDEQMQKTKMENAQNRKSQIGSGDRSERIRTYNYPQNRITDHRINLTLYNLEGVMLNGELDSIIDPLNAHAKAQALI